MHVLTVRDCSPFGDLQPADVEWLRRLQRQLTGDDHVVRLHDAASEDPEPVIQCDAEGRWRAGRYVGSLTFEGRRLDIEPRFPFEVLLRWIDAAFDFVALPNAAQLRRAEAFVPWLLAIMWAKRLDDACRHGLPSLRVDASHEGLYARGRIDVRRTAALQITRPANIASRSPARTLDNDIVRTLICAEHVLRSATRSDLWQTRRVRDLCAQMHGAVGGRPKLPSLADLARVRYTPIRLPFRPLVDLSHGIARRRGFLSANVSGNAEGILLDVAELWELFLVGCVRAAFPGFEVRHGTRVCRGDAVHLLRSQARPEIGLGRLLPDIVVADGGGPVALLDAKYKRLAWAPDRPDGVDRGDKYQLAAYLSRLSDGQRTIGALLYPSAPGDPPGARAEIDGPWLTRDGNLVHFARLPVDRAGCVAALEQLVPAHLTGDRADAPV